MKYQLEIEHRDMVLCKIVLNDKIIDERLSQKCCVFTIVASDSPLSIWFEPWRIKPLVRIDGVLVNYALANIDQFDHKIDLILDQNFVNRYRQRDIDYRVKSVFGKRQIDDYVYDSVIGVGQMNQDLLDRIHEIIDDK
jgi:hypothetical protein